MAWKCESHLLRLYSSVFKLNLQWLKDYNGSINRKYSSVHTGNFDRIKNTLMFVPKLGKK